eukprot:GFYU01002310.1.p1 GENE.GFYU01002310.1~~GFYU01002310.1.p1  ORF type:complete len:1152 (+),score=332.63 GFYU01002310.1:183-3638(+)
MSWFKCCKKPKENRSRQGWRIDESLVSRQLYVLGLDTMKRLGRTHILVWGLDGLGVEISKNLILAGPRSVSVYDPALTSLNDLSSQFYLKESDVGKPRSVCTQKLRELNDYVEVLAVPDETSVDDLVDTWMDLVEEKNLLDKTADGEKANYVVVVANSGNEDDQEWISQKCRDYDLKFVMCDALGVFGSIFVDFGRKFEVLDVTGKNPWMGVVTNIFKDKPAKNVDPMVATIAVTDDQELDIAIGTSVRFSGVVLESDEVSSAVNDPMSSYEVIEVNRAAYYFKVKDFPTSEYVRGGQAQELPQKCVLDFERLSESLRGSPFEKSAARRDSTSSQGSSLKSSRGDEEDTDESAGVYPSAFYTWDYSKFGRPELLHHYRQALKRFETQHGRFPALATRSEAAEVLLLLQEIVGDLSAETREAFVLNDVDEELVMSLAMSSTGRLSAMCAFIGGVAAQEALKSTGKFHPIHQWFHFDAAECLPDDYSHLSADDVTTQDRYAGQVAVLGKGLHKQICDAKVFLVGAGALGCEFLKGFAMSGLGCGSPGKVFLTDMDSIEKSNLNRQFLFRESHIGQMKSSAASKVGKQMNSQLKCDVYTDNVTDQTVFHDTYWENLDLVVNALDNVAARLYTDEKCVMHAKPLLESGTMGTMANAEVYLPHQTISYSTERDAPDKAVPQCTLKRFPYRIEHCIEWAKDLFAGHFFNAPSDANTYIKKGPAKWLEQTKAQGGLHNKKESLQTLLETLRSVTRTDFEACVQDARWLFEMLFVNDIKQLLHNFPPESKNSRGQLFWSGSKREPVPEEFSMDDELHQTFIISAANLLCHIRGGKPPSHRTDPSYFRKHNDIPDHMIPRVPTDVKFVSGLLGRFSVPPFKPLDGLKIETEEEEAARQGREIPATESDEKEMDALLKKITGYTLSGKSLYPTKFEKDDDTNFHLDFVTACANLRARNYSIIEADRLKTKQIAGSIIPAIATTTAAITGLVMMELFKVVAQKPLESFKFTNMNLAIPSSDALLTMWEPREAPKAKPEFDVILQENTVPYPPGYTLWDHIVVNEGGAKDLTVREFVAALKSQHGLVVSAIMAGRTRLWHDGGGDERLDSKVSELYQRLNEEVEDGVPLVKTQKYLLMEISASDEKQSELSLPPVKYQFRKTK